MAVDRDQITEIAMQGYTDPADCTGLTGTYDKWRDDVARRVVHLDEPYDLEAAAKAAG